MAILAIKDSRGFMRMELDLMETFGKNVMKQRKSFLPVEFGGA
jgi:hypothetical protein